MVQIEHNHSSRKIPKKKHFFFKKNSQKGVAFIGMRHLFGMNATHEQGGSYTFFRRNTLFLQHEGNNRNYAKDRISPDHHRGVCTHIRYYLGICHDT